MRKTALIFALAILIYGADVFADSDNGELLFKGFACNSCHDVTKSTLGPSLKMIAAGYDGKKDELIRYFDGKSHPIVTPDKSVTMRFTLSNTLEKLKKLADKDKSDLADFILKKK